jgi:hypothetical protein
MFFQFMILFLSCFELPVTAEDRINPSHMQTLYLR